MQAAGRGLLLCGPRPTTRGKYLSVTKLAEFESLPLLRDRFLSPILLCDLVWAGRDLKKGKARELQQTEGTRGSRLRSGDISVREISAAECGGKVRVRVSATERVSRA